MVFPSHGSISRRLTGETKSSSTTLHMDTCSWKLTGEETSTTPHVDILWLTGKVMEHILLDTRPQKLIGVFMTPNSNHVNESLLSEVNWGAHNPDANDPEELTVELIQFFLTFVVQLQWLVALGRLVTWGDLSPIHKSLSCPSLW